MEEILYKWIPSVGFPIAIAIYLLIRIEPKLTMLSDVVKQLISVVDTNTANTTEMIAIVRADTENTKDVKIAITNFTLGINDLKNEISKLNNKR